MPRGLLLWFLAGVWGSIVAHDKKPFASGAELLGWIVLGPYGLIAACLFRERVYHRCGRTLLANEDYYCHERRQASLRESEGLAEEEDTDSDDEDEEWDEGNETESEDEEDQ